MLWKLFRTPVFTGKSQFTRTYTTPPLWRALEHGEEVPIEEAELYQYQRYRWLTKDAEQLAARYRKFRLPALVDAAIEAAGHDASNCTKVLKCIEGQYNKSLILSMDNGQEVVARLPNPNAGPKFYTTASEVATRQFLRDRLAIPVPRIYAWSADEANAVGAEYILEEKASGQPLGLLWSDLPFSARSHIVDQVVDIEQRLTSVTFPRHGCIYFQSDLGSRPEHPSLHPIQSPDGDSQSAFVLGLLTHPRYWHRPTGEARLNLQRGPFKNMTEYARAIAKNEIQWTQTHAQPRMNDQRSEEQPETADEYIALLKRYIELVPYLVREPEDREFPSQLLHPDLHLDNIFVDPATNDITAVIDWQHAAASPVDLQPLFAQMLEPTTAGTGEGDDPLRQIYLTKLKGLNLRRWEALTEPYHKLRTDPTRLVPGCGERNDLFSLRHAMIAVVAQWDDVCTSGIKCPINFSQRELEEHEEEMELIEGVSLVLRQLQEQGLLPLSGMVLREQYDDAQRLNQHFRNEFIALGEDAKQRAMLARLWPYS
ncbi:hypothetical protein BO86DRAFT_413617 [Aspergillus japonicus CBS 114.51]|uniref:Altered inheritance of mitochondria protein 9, mitochondrial n=1 Tax=Aspergillus japonicus CBS 114.51 TaxID=1448312 RepID=A0A8T8WLY0_ASPJA|nr:hypothetical protein BO86DRAFT_413617 [Aspergillus japonicus CBS 114.51]RAH76776.1 hypothetical protein BO86DRAFT_413617 [Aspergillus japonicus CBS 114.51]